MLRRFGVTAGALAALSRVLGLYAVRAGEVGIIDAGYPVGVPERYGADPSGTISSDAAFANCVASLAAIGGGNVDLVRYSARYKMTAPLVIPGDKNIGMRGAGLGVEFVPVGAFDFLTVGTAAADNTSLCEFSGFSIDGTGLTGNGLTVHRMHSAVFRRIRVRFCTGHGIVNDRAYASKWEDVYSNNNTLDGINIGQAADLTVMEDCKFLANGQNGIHFTGGDSSGCRIRACDFEGNQWGVTVESVATMDSIELSDNYFENNVVGHARFGLTGPAQITELAFTGNHCNTGVAVPMPIALDRVGKATFQHNRLVNTSISKTANTGEIYVDISNSWSNTAYAPDSIVAETNGHMMRKSVEAGYVDLGTDVAWNVALNQLDQRRWQLDVGDGGTRPKGSLVPSLHQRPGVVSDGQIPHLGLFDNRILMAWFGALSMNVVTMTANGNIPLGQGATALDATAGAFTVTLPDPSTVPGAIFALWKTDIAQNQINVNVAPGGVGFIDTIQTWVIGARFQPLVVQSDGGRYIVVAGRKRSYPINLALANHPPATTQFAWAASFNVTEANRQVVITDDVCIADLWVQLPSACPGDGSYVVTLKKNGVDTALKVTIAAGSAAGQYVDRAHGVWCQPGDLVTLKFENNSPTTNVQSYVAVNLI